MQKNSKKKHTKIKETSRKITKKYQKILGPKTFLVEKNVDQKNQIFLIENFLIDFLIEFFDRNFFNKQIRVFFSENKIFQTYF